MTVTGKKRHSSHSTRLGVFWRGDHKRPKLHKIMEMAVRKEIDIILIEHKDRLTRFMFDYLVKFFKSHNVQIIWTNEVLGKSYEQELVEDILSLMASFSAKIYSKRAVKNRKREEGI